VTERLYYTDPYCREFDATVRAVERRDEGAVIILDRSAFYPTSGGQPFDTGILAGLSVVAVSEEDGAIAHVVEPRTAASSDGSIDASGMPVVGSVVHGEIDWSRRFDHMQQHTGQHVLSAVVDRLFGARTVSFHLGGESSTIDVARELAPHEILAAEQEANRIIWDDRPVSIRFVSATEAAGLPLRKESLREGTLRLIDVEGVDLSACGGTHVARTGSLGMIAIPSVERFKGGQRLDFLCGGRSLARFRSLQETVSASVRLLSALPGDVPASIEKLHAEAKEQKRAVGLLQAELVQYRAEEIASDAQETPVGRLVMRAVNTDAAGLKAIATTLTARPGYIVTLVSTVERCVSVGEPPARRADGAVRRSRWRQSAARAGRWPRGSA
jgi:alanyl-tRNA synthetase